MNIQNILTSGNKKHLPVVTKKRKFETFFEATATLMCIQLQQMCFRSIEAITDFLCIDEVGVGHYK